MIRERLGNRVADTAEGIAAVLAQWDEVQSVSAIAHGDDLYDPYLSIAIDAYLDGPARPSAERHESFAQAGAFESATLSLKDRFLLGSIPVRIEFKQTARFDAVVRDAADGRCALREGGTYTLYRLTRAQVLFSRDGWIEARQSAVEVLPDGFWAEVKRTQWFALEHIYSDLTAAEARSDAFYFALSAGRFAAAIAALQFTIRRQFAPSPRELGRCVLELPDLPDSFPANLEHFSKPGLEPHQRVELARLMLEGSGPFPDEWAGQIT